MTNVIKTKGLEISYLNFSFYILYYNLERRVVPNRKLKCIVSDVVFTGSFIKAHLILFGVTVDFKPDVLAVYVSARARVSAHVRVSPAGGAASDFAHLIR